MSSVKLVQSTFPSNLALVDEERLTKRRKTVENTAVNASNSFSTCSSSESSGGGGSSWLFSMDTTDNHTVPLPPSVALSHSLADHGLPDRFDPQSMDHFVYFEGSDGRSQGIPQEFLAAIQCGNICQWLGEKQQQRQPYSYFSGLYNRYTPNHKSKRLLQAMRNSQGETLLHLASRWSRHGIVKRLLELQLPTLVLDQQGRTPLHSLCLSMNNSNGYITSSCDHTETMRLLLRHTPTLVLYMDQQRKTPFEYLQCSQWHVMDLIRQEQVVERVVQEIAQQTQRARSGQQMTVIETVDRIVNLTGLDAAVMETGFSI
jgi:hypothetical protein